MSSSQPRGLADTPAHNGFVILNTKLRPPPVQDRLVPRPALDALLGEVTRRRLCLVSAPAGFGKTALLSSWSGQPHQGVHVAWVSLDEDDNDPFRFWSYLTEAMCRIDPALNRSVRLHPSAGSEHTLLAVVLPHLINVLDTIDFDLVLVLDDLHVIRDPVCHHTLRYFFDHAPPRVHLCLSTRADPPLPLARLRARAELVEIRSTELAFTRDETGDLLNWKMSAGLEADQVEQLYRLTEGWPAALHLAGLSIQSGARPDSFVASFTGGNRHVFDYLGSEVLRRMPEDMREFLAQTSILRRLSAPLCDHLCERTDSSALIAELETGNSFIVPLDRHRAWYRFHHLFAATLRLDLQALAPHRVQQLHLRAADWFESAGEVEDAIHHAVEAQDHDRATRLVVSQWQSYERSGQLATVGRWLAQMPAEAIAASAHLAVIAALNGAKLGAPRPVFEQRLLEAEAVSSTAVEHAGSFPLPFAIAFARAMNCYGDVGESLTAARAALRAVGNSYHGEYGAIAGVTLGRALYLVGETAEAREVLTATMHQLASASAQPFCAINAWALLSLLADESHDLQVAAEHARLAFDVVQARQVRFDPMSGVAHLACARAARRAGRFTEAHGLLVEAVSILQPVSYLVQRGEAWLELALVQHALGETDDARASWRRAAEIVDACADPGRLAARVAAVSLPAQSLPRPHHDHGEPLTPGELRVLRFLDTQLSQAQIAAELYVSVNTVRTHIRAVYRKLGVTSRDDAVRTARGQGLNIWN